MMQNNEDFLAQTGEVEKLKQTRTRKRGEEKPEKKEETPVVQNDFVSGELAKFNLSDAVIAEWQKDFLPLKVEGVNDKEGLTKVTEAWRTVRNTRIQIEKKGKELRADALRFQKSVISEEKRLVDQLSPIEQHLEEQKNFVEREKERIRKEREEQMQRRVQMRTSELLRLGFSFNGEIYELVQPGEETIKVEALQVKLMEDKEFNIIKLKGEIAHEKERIRREEEDKKRQEESDRLAKIAAEQEAERKRLEEIRLENERKAAELKAEQDRIEAEKRAAAEAIERQKREVEEAKRRAEELEKAKAEAAAKALRDAEEARKKEEARIAAEKKVAEEKAEAERKERERLEALKPDQEKLATFTEKFAAGLLNVKYPEMTTEGGKKALETIKAQNTKFAAWLKTQKIQ